MRMERMGREGETGEFKGRERKVIGKERKQREWRGDKRVKGDGRKGRWVYIFFY